MSRLFVVGAALLVAACGGGGSEAPPNQAPAFTSSSSVSVAEGTGDSIYTAAATDAEGQPVSFSLAGGADAAAFSITPAGVLSFVGRPDFDQPGDADGNNVYRVQINASDGMATSSLMLDVTITNVPDLLTVRRVATGLDRPVALAAYPEAGNRVVILEKTGRARLLDPATGTMTTFLDISAAVSTNGDRGLLGLTFAPDFATSRAFYVFMTNLAGETEIRRYRAQTGSAAADPATADVILKFAQPTEFNQGGWIAFGPDGLLYIGTGDGAADRANADAAFGGTTFRGKILRIDPSKDDFPADADRDYGITSPTRFNDELWAIGVRNLKHASFDPATGDLWFSDPALTKKEINRLPKGEVEKETGFNRTVSYGWNRHDGASIIAGAGFPGITNCCHPPVLEYSEGATPVPSNAVVGGYVYRGPLASLRGEYFFGDGATLRSFALSDVPPLAGTRGIGSDLAPTLVKMRSAEFAPNAGSYTVISGFGTDTAGNLFILDNDGEVFMVEAR